MDTSGFPASEGSPQQIPPGAVRGPGDQEDREPTSKYYAEKCFVHAGELAK